MSEPIPATELTLTRTHDDRKWFALEGVGWVHLGDLLSGHQGRLRVGDLTWVVTNDALVGSRYVARAESGRPHDGEVVGSYVGDVFGGGAGKVDWAGRPFTVSAVGFWKKTRLRLEHDGTPLAEFVRRSDRSKPVQVLVAADEIPSGLLLLMAYVSCDLARRSRARSGPVGGGDFGGTSGGGGSGGAG